MPIENPTHHTCTDCGYTWAHGQHGGHSCTDRLRTAYVKAGEREHNLRLLLVERNERIAVLFAALQGAKEWLEGWASAEPYLSRINSALATAPQDVAHLPTGIDSEGGSHD